jgi:hypothetical protein
MLTRLDIYLFTRGRVLAGDFEKLRLTEITRGRDLQRLSVDMLSLLTRARHVAMEKVRVCDVSRQRGGGS